MLVKSDFILKLAIKSEASSSKASLAIEKEFLIIYSFFKRFEGLVTKCSYFVGMPLYY